MPGEYYVYVISRRQIQNLSGAVQFDGMITTGGVTYMSVPAVVPGKVLL